VADVISVRDAIINREIASVEQEAEVYAVRLENINRVIKRMGSADENDNKNIEVLKKAIARCELGIEEYQKALSTYAEPK
jgi:hypothetical protein